MTGQDQDMSGPYSVFYDGMVAYVNGPTIKQRLWQGAYEAEKRCKALNAAYAAGLAASGREAEIRGMERAWAIADKLAKDSWGFTEEEAAGEYIAKAIQSEIDKARALTPTDDREYREAVEKLLKEGSS